MPLFRTTLPIFLEYHGDWLFRIFPRLVLVAGSVLVGGGIFAIAILDRSGEMMRHTEDTSAQLVYGSKRFFKAYRRFPLQQREDVETVAMDSVWLKTDERLVRTLFGFDESENPENTMFNEWFAVRRSRNGTVVRGGIDPVEWLEQPHLNKGTKIPVGPLVDAWGKCYRIRFDYDRDGWLANPIRKTSGSIMRYSLNGERIKSSILVVSAGPMGTFKHGKTTSSPLAA
ncbi:MAG: hypothetical protein R3F19_19400 [Verrucomicrobiales bacterium]